MKEPWRSSKDKLIAVEEGTSRSEEHECTNPAGRNDVCKQAIQCVKLFLYLGLLMIVGWACYSIWQPYHAQSMEVKVTSIIRDLESQKLLSLEEQPKHEISTIATTPFYESEDSKEQDAVAYSFMPNTESSLDWPTSTDYPDWPDPMIFPFFPPSFSSMKVDESEKEPESSESSEGWFDISEESHQLKEDEKVLLENYMLLSLFVQNSVRISEALKDSKEVVDPKFQLKLESFGPLGRENNSGPLELEDSSRLELDNSGPLQWFPLGRFEFQKEIGSDLKDSEEKTISTEADDNYESATLNILKNTHEIVPEDSTEPEQEETLIKSNEQMHQSIDSEVVDWLARIAFGEGKNEEEQSLLEKSTVRNAEASEDSTEEVDHNFKLTSEDLSRSEIDNSGPFDWVAWDRFLSQKEIGSELDDSEEKPISTQVDDNYESTTLNILKNAHEIVPEDSTELEQEETLIKSNDQMHQLKKSEVVAWPARIVFGGVKHEEEQSLLEKSTVSNAEASEDSTEEVDHNFELTSEDLSRSEIDNSGPFDWVAWGRFLSQKEIGSELDDSEEKPISTQVDDNYESATLNILKNAHEIVPEDSTEPEQEETLIKSNEQMHQSVDSAVEDSFDQSASEDRKHEEEQATDETEAEIEDEPVTDGFSLGNESDEEPKSDNYYWRRYKMLLTFTRAACSDISSYPWDQYDLDDYNYDSYESYEQDICKVYIKKFCEHAKRKVTFDGCFQYTMFMLRSDSLTHSN